jgi:ribosomal protein L32E
VIDEGKQLEKKKELIKSKAEVLEYLKTIRMFVNAFIDFMKDIMRVDKESKYTLQDDVKNFHTKYDGSFTDFMDANDKKSKLLEALYNSSPKFIRIIFNILKTKGTVMIYSNYVEMEGLQLLKIYLSFFGFIGMDEDKELDKTKLSIQTKLSKDGLRWCEFHGGIERETRRLNKEIFNKSDNKYGNYCKIIMISPAGAEGINLNNVRQVHILEPYWNEVRIEQVIGRALRYCQHKDLPMEERRVDIFRYKMVRTNGKITTDEKMEDISRKKNNLLLSFIEAIKEAAVDCELFKAHNMMGSKYKCFQFNEDSLFEKPIGPAFQSKIEYDQKADNGSNAKDSNRLKIKVRKIKAVKQLDENSYSKEDDYWFYEDSGVVYDYKLNYPIGKIGKDENGQYILLDNDIYVIGEIIDIPKITLR